MGKAMKSKPLQKGQKQKQKLRVLAKRTKLVAKRQ